MRPNTAAIVVETKAGDLELVAKPDLIVIHVSDHGKPMKLTSGSGKVTVFNGNDKSEAPLALVGDKLEAKGNFKVGAGTKVLAEVSLEWQAGRLGTVHAEVTAPSPAAEPAYAKSRAGHATGVDHAVGLDRHRRAVRCLLVAAEVVEAAPSATRAGAGAFVFAAAAQALERASP